MKRNIIYIVLLLIAVLLIGVGIFLLLNPILENSENNKINVNVYNENNINNDTTNKENVENIEDNNESITDQLNKNITIESSEESTDFYYNSAAEEKVRLFSIRTSEQLNKNPDSVKDMDVQLEKEVDGVRYYTVTSTGAIIDIVGVKAQLENDKLTDEQRNALERKLQEYIEMQKIYEQKEEIVENYINSK